MCGQIEGESLRMGEGGVELKFERQGDKDEFSWINFNGWKTIPDQKTSSANVVS